MKHYLAILLATALPAYFLMPAPAASAEAQGDCRPLIENKCGSCHFVNYICPDLRKNKGVMAWGKVVDNMVDLGARINKEEKGQLTACLARPEAEVKDLCVQSAK
ncbi:MAG: hypothetical protein Q4G66_02750 [bacterium]|nr:hypothetical protein [bacterium]